MYTRTSASSDGTPGGACVSKGAGLATARQWLSSNRMCRPPMPVVIRFSRFLLAPRDRDPLQWAIIFPSPPRRASGSALPWVLALGGMALLLILFCGGGAVVIAIIGWRGAERQPAAQRPVDGPPMMVPPIGKAPVGAPPAPQVGGQPVQARFG